MNESTPLSPFVVIVNSDKTIEYFRNKPLTEKQNADLDAIDKKLERGINLAGEQITHPSAEDKAIFMANIIANALLSNDDAAAAMACSYLATRYAHLKQLKITHHDDRTSIELINDQLYAEPIPVKFIPKKDLM